MYCYKGTDGRRDRPPSLIIIVVLIVLILLGPPPIRPSSVHSIKADRHFCMTMGGEGGGKAGRRNECKLQVACDTFGDYSCVDCVILASCARGMQSICIQSQTCKCGGLRMREGRKGKALILFLCPFQPKFLSRSSPFRPTRVTRLMQYGGYYTNRC